MRSFFVELDPDSNYGQVVGEHQGTDSEQYLTVDASIDVEIGIESLYYKNGQVRVKPDPPDSKRYSWDRYTEDYKEIPDTPSPPPLPANFSGLNADLSPDGKLGKLLIKAMNTKASPMLQGMLPTAIAFGNLSAMKASLEAIIAQMPADNRFTVDEMTALDDSFKSNRIPARVVVKERLLKAVVSVEVVLQ